MGGLDSFPTFSINVSKIVESGTIQKVHFLSLFTDPLNA